MAVVGVSSLAVSSSSNPDRWTQHYAYVSGLKSLPTADDEVLCISRVGKGQEYLQSYEHVGPPK